MLLSVAIREMSCSCLVLTRSAPFRLEQSQSLRSNRKPIWGLCLHLLPLAGLGFYLVAIPHLAG